jgi:transcriptional regulator with XRE-family HTH domain
MKKYSFASNETAPFPNWQKIQSSYPIQIANAAGDGLIHVADAEIDAWKNEDDEVFIPGDISVQLEDLQARLMGLLLPEQMKELRESLGFSQNQMSALLQLGGKTWHRWETGKERPSRSLNILLHALYDGRIDVAYLQQLQSPPVAKEIVVPPAPEAQPYAQSDFSVEKSAANEELALAA